MASRAQTVSLVVLATVAVGAALYWLRPVMIPFVLAVFIAMALTPLIDFQVERLRLPRGVALVTTLLLGLVALGALASLVSISVAQLSENADAYAAQVRKLLQRIVGALPEIGGVSPQQELAELLRFPVKTVGGMLVGTTNAIVGLLSNSLLVFIFVAFLLFGGGGRHATGVWREAESSIKRYLLIKAVLSAATGFFVGLTLMLLGIDLAMVFGLFAFLLNFIPSIGSIVATLLPLPVVVVSPDVSFGVAILALAVPGAVQMTIGSFLEPRIMGDSLHLHPVTVLLSLVLWGMLWGIVGMLLATPITAVMRILFEKFEGTRTLAEVMAGRLDALRSPEGRARIDPAGTLDPGRPRDGAREESRRLRGSEQEENRCP